MPSQGLAYRALLSPPSRQILISEPVRLLLLFLWSPSTHLLCPVDTTKAVPVKFQEIERDGQITVVRLSRLSTRVSLTEEHRLDGLRSKLCVLTYSPDASLARL